MKLILQHLVAVQCKRLRIEVVGGGVRGGDPGR